MSGESYKGGWRKKGAGLEKVGRVWRKEGQDRVRAGAVTHLKTETLRGRRAVDEATPPHVLTLSRLSQGDVTGGRWTPAERWRHTNPKIPSALGLPDRNPTTTTTLALGRGAALIGPGPSPGGVGATAGAINGRSQRLGVYTSERGALSAHDHALPPSLVDASCRHPARAGPEPARTL